MDKKCYLCNKGGKELNLLSPSLSELDIDLSLYMYGMQSLHLYICITEWLLKVAYYLKTYLKMKLIKFKLRKIIRLLKIIYFFKNLRDKGFAIDIPWIEMGRSTDSNMCRALFNDCKYFSTVLSLDIDFILGKKTVIGSQQ